MNNATVILIKKREKSITVKQVQLNLNEYTIASARVIWNIINRIPKIIGGTVKVVFYGHVHSFHCKQENQEVTEGYK